MARLLLLSLFALLATVTTYAQPFETPVIGAQVFIEPGQTEQDIDEFFSILERNRMKVARIRMFGSHIFRDGGCDFSLYDTAFDAAQRHGIKIFATLFPTTDELNDVGGFKFPESKAHLAEIDKYITSVVRHFRNHPALSTWVLQNEPGQKAFRMHSSDLYEEVLSQWKETLTKSNYDNGFLKADFEKERFVTYYTSWYLKHIAAIVMKEDPVHGRHVNPFSILGYMSAHDYDSYSTFLTSLGLSMHYASHFSLFNTDEYTMASSLMNDIIRCGARNNPYWVTEIQGGNVMASGRTPYCPSGNHISQYLWTSLARGASGIMFWTLNPRGAVQEAGEWGLIDFLRQDTDRMVAARKVALALEQYGKELKSMKPVSAPISILYSHESFYVERFNAMSNQSSFDARKIDAVEKSLSVAYQAISANGVCPEVCEMKAFNWDNGENRIAILPDCIAVPSEYWDKISGFVKSGGKLIVTGRSFYYDENMFCTFMYRPFPLKDCFGAEMKEYKVTADYFSLDGKLTGHLWRGIIEPKGATTLLESNGEVLGTRNSFGKGQVVWLPTPIELGAYHRDMSGLEEFYSKECKSAIELVPVRYKTIHHGIQMAVIAGDESVLLTISNKTSSRKTVNIVVPFDNVCIIDGSGRVKGKQITLDSDQFITAIYRK